MVQCIKYVKMEFYTQPDTSSIKPGCVTEDTEVLLNLKDKGESLVSLFPSCALMFSSPHLSDLLTASRYLVSSPPKVIFQQTFAHMASSYQSITQRATSINTLVFFVTSLFLCVCVFSKSSSQLNMI